MLADELLAYFLLVRRRLSREGQGMRAANLRGRSFGRFTLEPIGELPRVVLDDCVVQLGQRLQGRRRYRTPRRRHGRIGAIEQVEERAGACPDPGAIEAAAVELRTDRVEHGVGFVVACAGNLEVAVTGAAKLRVELAAHCQERVAKSFGREALRPLPP